jgi:hypothetical protein
MGGISPPCIASTPAGDPLAKTIALLDAVFPAKTNSLNTELSRTLAALGSSEIAAKTVHLMRTAKDDPVPWLSVERMRAKPAIGWGTKAWELVPI